jgi:hypothetical protein
MATAIQAVPSVITVSRPLAPWAISPLAQRADSLFIVPSVIVALGANSPVPLTYNSAGLFDSSTSTTDLGLLNVSATALDSTGTAVATAPATTTTTAGNGASIATVVASTGNPISANITPPLNSPLLGNADLTAVSTQKLRGDTAATGAAAMVASNANDLVAAAPVATAPVDTTTATPATASATASAAVSNAPSAPMAADTSGSPADTSALADSFLLDSVAQAETTIEGNPAYASAASGLYMSAMIFHLQQSSAAGPASVADSVQLVTAPSNVSAVKLIRG